MSGIYGNIFSMTDQNQFNEMLTIYNYFCKKFGISNYFMDYNNDCVVFLRKNQFTLHEFEQMTNSLYTLKLQHDFNLVCENKCPTYSNNVFKFYLKEKINHNVIKNN